VPSHKTPYPTRNQKRDLGHGSQPFDMFTKRGKELPEFSFGRLAIERIPHLLRGVIEFQSDLP